jgi:hypothetical protein
MMIRFGIVFAAAAALTSAMPSPYASKCEKSCTTITACQRLNAEGTSVSTAQSQKDTFLSFVAALSSEEAIQALASGELPPIVTPDVRGRVNPIGEFNDPASAIE